MFVEMILPKASSIYTKSSNYLTSKAYPKYKNTPNINHNDI